MSLTRKQLIRSIAKETGITQKKTSELLHVLLATITKAVASGDYVLIRKFCKFHLAERSARTIRHPVTGGNIFIAKKKVIKFKCSNFLKRILNHESLDEKFYKTNQARLQSLYDISEENIRISDNKNLRYENLRGADLSETDLAEVDLSNVNLSDAQLFEADLQGTNLEGAILDGATIMWANLAGANLRRASLQNADLRWANLMDADLTKANLRYANLTGANIENTILVDADLRGAKLRKLDIKNK